MKTFWTISNDAGVVVVENIFDRLAAEEIAKKLVADFGRAFIVREYGLRGVMVFKPKGPAQ